MSHLTGQSPELQTYSGNRHSGVILFQLRVFQEVRALLRDQILAGHTTAEPPLLRFCLSHFRPRSTTSKPIGPRPAWKPFCAAARYVPKTPSSAMAVAANRHTMNTTIGSGFGAAVAGLATRHSPSCRPSLLPTAITVSSPAARRCSAASRKADPGRLRRPRSKIRIVWPIPPHCVDGSTPWIPRNRRFHFYARRCGP